MRRTWRACTQVSLVGLLAATGGSAQETASASNEDWLPAQCAPMDTVGFHDEPELSGEPEEKFEPTQFTSTPFLLRRNLTLNELLDDVEDNVLYITLELEDEHEFFELKCTKVIGASREAGLSCVNTPPSDLLMLNPKSMRFTRAAIGSWTFQSTRDLERGSSLFVQMGQCYSLDAVSSDSDSN